MPAWSVTDDWQLLGALTTIQITATRWPTQPTNGMDIGQRPESR